MLPSFQTSFPQQIRTDGKSNTNTTSLPQQQFMKNSSTNHQTPCLPSPSNMTSNTHFNNISSLPNNPNFLNLNTHYQQLPIQNTQMGHPQISQLHPHLHNLNQFTSSAQSHGGQFFVNNHPQVCTNMPPGQFNFNHLPQQLNQLTGFPNGQFIQNPIGFPQVVPFNLSPCSNPLMGCLNQGVQNQVNQNLAFLMNQQMGMMNPHGFQHQNQQMFTPSTMGQTALQEPSITSQNLPRNSLSSLNSGTAQMQQTQNNLQSDVFGNSQGNHSKDSGSYMSNINQRNSQSKNFTRTHRESGKKESHNQRYQKSSFHPKGNAKGNFSPFKGKGHNDEGGRKPSQANCTKQTSTECRRSLASNYTEEEIKQWREERRKNHPSKSNNEKKLSEVQTDSKVVDNDALKRRQQLKEILAKQAELGVEVAEIPPNYLSDSENQVCEREQNRNLINKGSFQNKYGKRQRRGKFSRYDKKQKLRENVSFSRPALSKKKPTLLQKLLNADVKRDKSHLLQAFRFIVLNSFFKDWPKKPLEFPSITVKDVACGSEVEEKSSPHQGESIISGSTEKDLVEEFETPNDHDTTEEDDADGNDAETEETVYQYVRELDSIREENSGEEEGELTD